jgi:hypothetical protein
MFLIVRRYSTASGRLRLIFNWNGSARRIAAASEKLML